MIFDHFATYVVRDHALTIIESNVTIIEVRDHDFEPL